MTPPQVSWPPDRYAFLGSVRVVKLRLVLRQPAGAGDAGLPAPQRGPHPADAHRAGQVARGFTPTPWPVRLPDVHLFVDLAPGHWLAAGPVVDPQRQYLGSPLALQLAVVGTGHG